MVTFVNRRAQEVLGLDRDRALGRPWLALFCPPDQREAAQTLWRQSLRGARGIPYEGAFRDSGGRERRVRWHFTTLPSPGGILLCSIGVDVTEESELGARARRAERLAALGTMTAGLAHEIRNPLNAAHLQLSVVERRLRQTPGDPEAALRALALVDGEMQGSRAWCRSSSTSRGRGPCGWPRATCARRWRRCCDCWRPRRPPRG